MGLELRESEQYTDTETGLIATGQYRL